jgi:hypothetical protein
MLPGNLLNQTKRKIHCKVRIERYSEEMLAGVLKFSGILPQAKKGDIMLLLFNYDCGEDLREVYNLTHSGFDFIDIDSI